MPKKTIYCSKETIKRLEEVKELMLITTILSGDDWIKCANSGTYIFNEGLESLAFQAETKIEELAKSKNTTESQLYNEALKVIKGNK